MKGRPWGYYVVYTHTKHIFFCFYVLEVIFDRRILTVISSLSFYFEIVNFSEAFTWNSRMGNYSAPLSPVDIQKPPPNLHSEVLSENSKPNENKRKWAWQVYKFNLNGGWSIGCQFQSLSILFCGKSLQSWRQNNAHIVSVFLELTAVGRTKKNFVFENGKSIWNFRTF